MRIFSFSKDEILRKKKLIDRLFNEGSSFYLYPCKVYWLLTPLDTEYPAQVMIIAGKKAFKHAVDRNRTRRQIREAYRLQKQDLYKYLDSINQQCLLGIIYTSQSPAQPGEMNKKIKAVFKRLSFEISKKLNNSAFFMSAY